MHFADILTPNPPQNSAGIFLHDDTTVGETAGCVAGRSTHPLFFVRKKDATVSFPHKESR